jgi:hypothetical protein
LPNAVVSVGVAEAGLVPHRVRQLDDTDMMAMPRGPQAENGRAKWRDPQQLSLPWPTNFCRLDEESRCPRQHNLARMSGHRIGQFAAIYRCCA